jgi:SAM-dependent methyltransferase
MTSSSHESFYSQPELYDIAFSFKKYAAECEFMLAEFKKLTGRTATSWLELAAGPARHSLEMSQRGLKSQALDLSEDMVNYGKQLAESSGVSLDYCQRDMTDFRLTERVDLVGLMIDSMSYVLTNETLYQHFACVAEALNDDGLYVIEMSHPKDVFGQEQTAGTDWEIERAGTKVRTQWGDKSDKFDTITQITEVTVRISSETAGQRNEYVDHARQRCYTCTEFQALIQASGCFELVSQFGAMDPRIDLHHKRAWRMISVLRKKR